MTALGIGAQAARAQHPAQSFRMLVLTPNPLYRRRGKTNFFEKRVGEYQKSGVMAGLNADNSKNSAQLSFDDDF